jgi:hypothetical protein
MVHTIRHINKAIKICEEQGHDLDEEQRRLDKRREKGKKQGTKAKKQERLNLRRRMAAKQEEILRDARRYIFSRGARVED